MIRATRLAPAAMLAAALSFSASCSSVRSVERSGNAERGGKAAQAREIRVLIDSGKDTMKLSVTGPAAITNESGAELLSTGGPASLVVSSQASGIQVRAEPEGRTASAGGSVRIVSKRGDTFIYDGIAYAGSFSVLRENAAGCSLINVLSLETYLEGVLPHELGIRGPDEFAALEAQAIAARTYALSRMIDREQAPFDVYASVKDQVYRGRKGVHNLANSAVQKTGGMVLEYGGKLAFAYYCSSCGGHTADISLMWPDRRDAPYLKGVRDRDTRGPESLCGQGRNFRWRYSFSGRELGALVRETVPRVLGVAPDEVGYLHDVRITGRSASGRVTGVEIETSRGAFTVAGDRIRWVFLADRATEKILPSAMFDFQKMMDGDRLAFLSIVGGGNGHGIGMCQLGALEMARRGHTFQMILEHYYPGCSIARKY
ncbi:MAG: SpoIID/LytB domain-containing protein [Chitinivibrionia bacterium]|nr:SpoIID/LytB domain-containing protein [Chitinivibrionia bacterium]